MAEDILRETGSDEEAAAISGAAPVGEDVDYDEVVPHRREVAFQEVPDAIASDLAASTNVMVGDASVEGYDRIKQGIVDGDSPEMLQAQGMVGDMQQQQAKDVAMNLMADPGVADEEKEQILLNLQDRLDELDKTTASLQDHVTVNMAAASNPESEEGRKLGDSLKDNIDSYLDLTNNLQALSAEAAETINLDGKTVIEGILLIAPLYEGLAWRDFVENNLGSDWNNEAKIVAPGELREEVQSHVNGLLEQGRFDDVEDFFVDMMAYLRENGGVIGGNNFLAVADTLSAFDEVLAATDPENVDWDRWILNVTGVLDAIPFIGGAAKGIKAALKINKTTHMARMSNTNVKIASEVATAAAKDEKVAEMVGETGESLRAAYVLPKDAAWNEINAPAKITESIQKVDAKTMDLMDHADEVQGFLTAGKEAQIASESLRESLKNVGAGKVWIGDTALEKTEGGYRASAIVAASDESGWATKEAAEAANKELFSGAGEIVSRRFQGEPYQTLKGKDFGQKPEYEEFFIKQESNQKIVFTDDDFAITFGGKVNPWVFDPDSRFAKTWSTKGNVSFDQFKFFEKQLESFFDPVAKLNSVGQRAVSKLLRVGRDREKVYSPRELRRYLRATGMQGKALDKGIEAYREARQGFDTMYMMEDQIFRKSLTKDGYSHVEGVGGFNGFGRVVTNAEVRKVYNPKTQAIEELTDQSAQLIELRSPVRVGEGQTKYVKMSDDVQMKDLPPRVLSYRKGYVPTMYKENYFIDEIVQITDHTGKRVSSLRTINSTSSLLEGNKQIAKLKGKSPDAVYKVRHDRDMDSDGIEQAMSDIRSRTGGIFYSKRGERVRDTGDEVSDVVEPIEAGINASRMVARRTAMGPFIEDLKVRWMNTYRKFADEGRFPAEGVLIQSDDLNLAKDVARAKSMHQYIRMLEGQIGNNLTFRKSALNVADSLEDVSPKFKPLSDGLRYMSDKLNPISRARALTFTSTLGTDPIRQLLLQPSQILFTGTLAPIDSIRSFRVGRVVSRLSRKKSIKPMSNKDMDRVGKGLGMEPGELKKLVDQFDKSGLGSSITSHELARDVAKPLSAKIGGNAAQKAIATARVPVDKGLGMLRRGFERGEEINIGTHWMLARIRWMKKNPGKDPSSAANALQISGEARSIALSMTQSGDLAYQRGFMSLPMQFFAVQHKAMLAMATNQQFTKAERARVVLGQAVLWGPAGLGLTEASALLSEQFNLSLPEWFKDGLMETVINNALSAITGDDIDFDISATLAPASGVYDNIVTTLVDSVLHDSFAPSELLGPSKSVFNRIEAATQGMTNMWNTDPDMVDMEAVRSLSGEQLVSVYSSYNRLTKGLAMLASDHWLDKHGRRLLPASALEAIAFGALGITSDKVDAMYTLQGMLGSPINIQKSELQEAGDIYYDQVLRLTNKYLAMSEAGVPYPEVIALHKAEVAAHNMMINSYGAQAEVIMQSTRARINRATSGTKQDELITSLAKLYAKGENKNAIQFAIDEGLVEEDQGNKMLEVFNFAWGIEE